MEFTLYYRGELKANRGAKDKHVLRQCFHPQLRELWNQMPLSKFSDYLKPKSKQGDLSVLQNIGPYVFAPLVTKELYLIAELNILFLRPEAPGAIVTQGGDIDNRLKTLLDALKVPAQPNALPSNVQPKADENPFYCLLEDDNLITKLNVETDRLLDPVKSPNEVVLIIRVKTKQLRVVIGTIGLA